MYTIYFHSNTAHITTIKKEYENLTHIVIIIVNIPSIIWNATLRQLCKQPNYKLGHKYKCIILKWCETWHMPRKSAEESLTCYLDVFW